MPLSDFGDVADMFADYGTTLRGYVRYHVSQRNLLPWLPNKPARVLDVGGGSGPDAAWLSGLGYAVTLIEPSDTQREYARRRFNFFLSDDERARITTVPYSFDEFKPSKQLYDLVLIHGVTMYQPNPAEFLKMIAKHLKPGGILSVMEKGYYGAEARSIREEDFGNIPLLIKNQRFVNHYKQEVHAFKPEVLEQMIVNAGATVNEWSGVRVITDENSDEVSVIDKETLKIILDTEYEQGHNPAIRGQGQLLHFIATKQ